jgi:hypothetical protein
MPAPSCENSPGMVPRIRRVWTSSLSLHPPCLTAVPDTENAPPSCRAVPPSITTPLRKQGTHAAAHR